MKITNEDVQAYHRVLARAEECVKEYLNKNFIDYGGYLEVSPPVFEGGHDYELYIEYLYQSDMYHNTDVCMNKRWLYLTMEKFLGE